MNVKKVILTYDIADELPLSYGHKLRGFFANNFSEILFHNHKKSGDLRYGYPLIQYKIIDKKPVIVGLNEGAELITKYFLEIDEIKLGDKVYNNPQGKLEFIEDDLIVEDFPGSLYHYKFISPWMGLSQKNYSDYVMLKERNVSTDVLMHFLGKIMVGNILSFAKGINWWLKKELVVVPNLKEITVNFKNEKMLGFVGEFYTNVLLPDFIGIGKSTSRGFGIIKLT